MKVNGGMAGIQMYLNRLSLSGLLSEQDDDTILLKRTQIKAKQILLGSLSEGSQPQKTASANQEEINKIISFERSLRSAAYKFVFREDFDSGFFDDSDMTGPYHLHVIYDNHLNVPLMSARSYNTSNDIINELGGYGRELQIYDQGKGKRILQKTESIVGLDSNSCMMIDRISEQLRNSPGVKRYRTLIYCLLFRSLFLANKGTRYVFGLVRVNDSELILAKYLQLGLNIIGKTTYRVGNSDREHWILKGDLFRIRKELPIKIQILKEIFK